LHRLTDVEREYLEAAALLHEIGLAISHSFHHRHSYYIIKNSDLLGFTENEKEIIANVARYHRKSNPKIKHEGFRGLSPDDQGIVTKLASILRIADGLDRAHDGKVHNVKIRTVRRTLQCAVYSGNKKDLEIEFWGAERKKDLFESIFKKKILFAHKK
jgi:exopolyphosphatase/guanosine-5'-triphosphate,3'-diphosphate pyrophosphatase